MIITDTQRLDWLSARGERLLMTEYETGFWGIGEYRGNVNDRQFCEVVPEEHETLRDAIDAAIRQDQHTSAVAPQ